MIKNILFMIRYSWNISKRRFVASGIEIILDTVEPFVLLILPKYIIDVLTGNGSWKQILVAIGILIGSMIVLRLIRMAAGVFINMAINRSDVKDGMSYANHFQRMDYDKFENGEIRDIQMKVSMNIRENNIIETIQTLLTSLFTLIGYLYIISTLSPVVALSVFVIVLLHYFFNKKISMITYEFQPTLAKYTRIFDYLFSVMASFDYAKEIRINKTNELLNKKFNNTLGKYTDENKKFLQKKHFTNVFSSLLSFFQNVLSYGYVTIQVIKGGITVGSFSMYIGAIFSLTASLNSFILQYINLTLLSKYADDYKEYTKKAFSQSDEASVEPLDETSNNAVIEYDNVSFMYPNTEMETLKHISIKIKKGEKLSIVGLNGAGKTTFIKLLCGLYRPIDGCIRYCGTDISNIKKSEYAKKLAVVFQDFKVFSFSFLENIILNHDLNTHKLKESILEAGLENKLSKLPKGMATSIFKDFDDEGIEFSGGESQKLVMARAYYKDAPIVILDEPTSALDAISEFDLYQKYNKITEGKTAIFISHRLASSRFCDHIAVFNAGEIVEYGTHDELMNKGGLYYNMFTEQAKYYLIETKDEIQ